jgi:hypothetical protein
MADTKRKGKGRRANFTRPGPKESVTFPATSTPVSSPLRRHTSNMSGVGTPERGAHGNDRRQTALANSANRDSRCSAIYAYTATPREHSDWKTYTFVDVYVSQLPKDVKTLEVFNNLHQFGNINRINITLTKEGIQAGGAVVRFKYVSLHICVYIG